MTGRRRRRWPFVAVVVVMVAVLSGAAAWLVLRPSADDRYLAALDDAGVSEQFQTDRAAVLRGQSICEDFAESGEPRGGAIENAAVEHFCPEWLDDFRILQRVTVTGVFEVLDADEYLSTPNGRPCEGEGGYGDINASTQVILSNGEGDTLARTELGPGTVDGGRCQFEFAFEVTEGEEVYVLAVGRRGETTYSFEEIKDGLTVGLY